MNRTAVDRAIMKYGEASQTLGRMLATKPENVQKAQAEVAWAWKQISDIMDNLAHEEDFLPIPSIVNQKHYV